MNYNINNSILKYKINYKDNEEYIKDIYQFNKVWNNKCKKYGNENQPYILDAVDRILVIGDIHGDFNMLIKTLKIGKVIDDNNDWCGNDTIIVQVGDQIDRCRYDINSNIPCYEKEATNPDEGNDLFILNYLTKLHLQATEHNGAVYSLLGNHELMNVDQDMRYVSYEGFREFDNYSIPEDFSIDDDDSIIESIKDNKIEDGTIARHWAFKKGNPLSEFLACTRQVALIIGSNLFVHAGILPKIAHKYSIKNINQIMTLYLLNILKYKKEYNDLFKNYKESPLWTREYGNMSKYLIKYDHSDKHFEDYILKCSKLLKPLKDIYNVDRIYVGHTPLLKDGMSSVCDKQVWLTDFGLSSVFDKFDNNKRSDIRKAQILEILKDGEQINILYDN